MADKTILELTNIGTLQSTDMFPVARTGSIADNGTTVGAINTFVKAQADTEPTTDSAELITSGAVKEAIDTAVENVEEQASDTYARKDGYYGQMGVGVADNLAGRGTVPAEYTFRTSGGTADLGTGSAAIENLLGKTLVWNQICPNGDFSNGIDGWTYPEDATCTVQDGVCTIDCTRIYLMNIILKRTITPQIVNGHKMMTIFGVKGPAGLGFGIYASGQYYEAIASLTGEWEDGVVIWDATNDGFQLRAYGELSGEEETYQFKNIRLFDLTSMFGAGYEPSTVAEFQQLYQLDWYNYNSGTLVNVTASGIKTVGFNLFNPSTGKAVIPSTTIGDTTNGTNCIQISGTYTSVTDGDGNAITPSAGGFFNVGAATELTVVGGNDTDTCIHYTWSGYRNGEYEPYEEHILYFNGENGSVATVTGKINGEGSSMTIFHEGMKSAGTLHDELTGVENGYFTKAIKRLGVVDLGSLRWDVVTYYGGGFAAEIPGMKSGGIASAIMSKYTNKSNVSNATLASEDKVWSTNNASLFGPEFHNLFLKDSDHSTAPSSSDNWVDGIMLCYELETPIEYTIDTPIPANYYVNDFGTEQRLPADTASVVAAPILYNVQYAMNAVDALRRLPVNYISTASMENFTTELASKLGTFLNATITVTPSYDSEHEEYDYSITIVENQQEP